MKGVTHNLTGYVARDLVLLSPFHTSVQISSPYTDRSANRLPDLWMLLQR